MNVEYRREMNRNYMVIQPDTIGNEKYTLRMISGNRIHGLLPFHDKMVNGEVKYYYDITSKQPLDRILEHRHMSGTELRTFMTELLFALNQMERFLLDEGQLVFQPEYIYVDPGTFKAAFCLVPGMHREFTNEFCELSQYLLDHVNSSDGDAVVLAFSIFRECRKLNFGMNDIEQCLRKFEENGRQVSPESNKEDVRTSENQEISFGEFNSGAKRENSNIRKAKELKMPKKGTNERVTEEEKQKQSTPKITVTEIAVILGIVMIIIPFAIFMWRGIHGLSQWKWILLITEIFLAAAIMILMCLRPGENEEKPSADKKQSTAKETHEREGLFGWSSFPEAGKHESLYDEEDSWEFQLRDPEEYEESSYLRESRTFKMKMDQCGENAGDEDEIQTVLLSSRPIYKECRKLVSVSDGNEISVGYFPFLIGKNRDLTDYCLNKPGVSRLHIKLEETDNGYTVTDLNSTNGTSVNGRLLEANETAVLKPGDELMIAGERFYFQ